MLLALAIAVASVLLGLGLGLAPAVSARALGPLRTLALTAVIAVVVLHLLPEALNALGGLGLLAFAAGLALPRWWSWARAREAHADVPEFSANLESASHAQAGVFGLELGFWGLIVHHLGDGLALGAYSRTDRGRGAVHEDVLFALVLHTVPLVAVIAMGYARRFGAGSAARRCGLLALASAVGVLSAHYVPAALVDRAQAWISAGVSGLLLHGMTHDLDRDLPGNAVERSVDLAAAIFGGALGWLGFELDAPAELERLSPVGVMLWGSLQRVSLPLAIGLVLGALLAGGEDSALGRYAKLSDPRAGGPLCPEAFLITLGCFGFAMALVRDLLSAVWLALEPARAPAAAHERCAENAPLTERAVRSRPEPRSSSFVSRLDAHLDSAAAWALTGALVVAVMRSAVPERALEMPVGFGLVLAVIFSLSVPLHAAAAPQLAFALVDKGFPAAAALLIMVIAPLSLRPNAIRNWLLIGGSALAAWALADRVPRQLLVVDSNVAAGACVIVFGLVLFRVYRLGLRGWLAPVMHAAEGAAAAHGSGDARALT